jgi:putative endopeptidase
MKWSQMAVATVLTAGLAGCASAPVSPEAPAGPKPRYGTFGFDVAGMDRSVAPGEGFYDYAAGTWLKTTEIPADRSNYGAFVWLTEEANARTRVILEEAAAQPVAAGPGKIAGDFYAAFLDEAGIEAKGLTPLQPELDRIAAIRTRRDLAAVLGQTLRADVDALNATDTYTDRLFGLWVAEDFQDPKVNGGYLMQGGLGMPDREYYLGDSARFQELRAAYAAHVARVMQLAGLAGDDAAARAAKVLALETAIARGHASATDTFDIEKGNNPWPRREFARRAPGLDWDAYFQAAGLAAQRKFIVWQPSAFVTSSKLTRSEPIEVWKDYLAFHAVERASPFLPRGFAQEHFAFNGKAVAGTPQLRERWKRGVDFANQHVGEAIGQIYVARHFPPEAKAQAQTLVRYVMAGFGQRIQNVAWMSPQTKARAEAKRQRMIVGVGYPDTWKDYAGLIVRRDDALGNAQRAELWKYSQDVASLGRTPDRNAWYLLPQEVNALNMPMKNAIIFPAAILQPPFFDPHADPAINYGAIGGVIGHEITHGFDDIGAMFDADGRLANWWTPQDLASFKAAGKALAAQYSAYEPLPDLNLNGELTLGENIADVAGLSSSYEGWRLSLGGVQPPVLDGFTGEQRFFLGWSQIYREKYRDEALRRRVLIDGHSPGRYRALTVRNIDAWYGAFDVQPGQALHLPREQRVTVW